ncbi:hypothetical protein QUC32_22955 [Novosphingobium resinovorum]|uniref:hypothetical protein n=1 Tax=Novosphingobium TaxID=165696 RepID=UPI001B3C5A67|nr:MULTISPECIES: hypothetical protein [Novosphingobium]MBF7012510.1 hypothetical protein [Novosphingobium sp. HR1a]WJM27245.1 hypothetical protein QUC32_22955 [Novosphingobium resinovorum]
MAWSGGEYIRVAGAPKPPPVTRKPPADLATKISIVTHDYRFEREIGRGWCLFRWVAPA